MSIIDEAAFADLLDLVGDAPDVLADIIDAFVRDALAGLEQMREAVGSGDGELLRRTAHTVKSISQSVGALAFARVAADIEALAASGQLVGIPPRLLALEAQAGAVAAELHRRRPDVGDGP